MRKRILGLLCVALVAVMGVMMAGCKVEYDFLDDMVVVVLTHEASLASRSSGQPYTVADFIEVGAVKVEYIGGWDNTPQWVIDAPAYRSIYTVTLPQKSHANVLAAVELLNERNDIQSAGPNRLLQPGDGGPVPM